MTTREDAVDAIEKLVRYIESANGNLREGLMDTPERVIKSYEEIYSGYSFSNFSSSLSNKSYSWSEIVGLS